MKTATLTATDRTAEATPQTADMTDWTGADFDSWQVLTSLNISAPITRVTRARQGQGQERTR
ncbi:hypothetical protein GCM10010331_74620 [Streptomyces xanthochromogenes]|uniref:hypothetical protein n=1 Tax=Streptomyces xanthochromogenes TaxID=67384 RepID=UPI001675621D|nr:hypothetical protein [Streptomyces xanthochromogenes]GHB75853.1 hypothetical protein GCM10010331_74620 [Streptomyces xanthochromogenes]